MDVVFVLSLILLICLAYRLFKYALRDRPAGLSDR